MLLIYALCCNFWANEDTNTFSTSKWPSEPYFCEINKYQCSYFNWLQRCDLKRKFMISSPVANLMHHPPSMNFKNLYFRRFNYLSQYFNNVNNYQNRYFNEQFIRTVKGQNNFWNRMLFYLIPGGFLDLIHYNSYILNWEK